MKPELVESFIKKCKITTDKEVCINNVCEKQHCECPNCGILNLKNKFGVWKHCNDCKMSWVGKQDGGSKKEQKYTCTFCGKYNYIQDFIKHLKKEHLKDHLFKSETESETPEEIESEVQTGSGHAQYYGKRSKITVRVPKNVKKWALYAFKLKKLGFEGAQETGWKRAKQLATKEYIPIEDLRYMRNWYARHVYTSYPGFKSWYDLGRPKDQKYHKKHAIQSWLTWGGNAGFRWVNSKRVIDLLNREYNKNYTKMKPIS